MLNGDSGMFTIFNFIPRLIESLTFYGGKGGGTQVVEQRANIPAYVQNYQQDIFNTARGLAFDSPLQVRQFAGLSDLENQGVNATSWLNKGFNPQSMQAAEQGIAGMASNAFLGNRIADYQNPYTQQVIDQSLADNDRARLMQQQGINAQALSRGAFGGSRQAIAESENNRNFMDQQARTSAGLRAQSYESALSAAQADRLAQMQNYELMNRSFLGNAQAQISAGDLQRDLDQQRLDAARNLPLERLGILQSAFSGSQLPYGSSTSSPTQRRNLVGSVGGGALSGAAAGASIGAAGGPIGAGTGALIGATLGLFS